MATDFQFLRGKILRLIGWFFLTLLVCLALAATAFDLMVVRTTVRKIESALISVSSVDRNPPPVLVKLLKKRYGKLSIQVRVAQSFLDAHPNQVGGLKTLERGFMELGVGLLLPIHLSEQDILIAHTSTVNMGDGIQGYADASEKYLSTPLNRITPVEAATLVAISHAPSAYVSSPERLARRAQELLSLIAE